MRTSWVAVAVLACIPFGALAAPPDVGTIVADMKAAVDPARPSVRRLTFKMSGAIGVGPHVVLGQARKEVGGTARILNVVLAPASLKGIAYLVRETHQTNNLRWTYLPAIGRVRKIVSPEAFVSFLNSDFTYADLGFVDLTATYKLLGEDERDGKATYQVESIPAQQWYYGRIMTWIDTKTSLPVERNYYDDANQLWKVEHWSDVVAVDGVPTAGHISMEDVQSKTKTDIDVDAITYEADVPDSLFEPSELPRAASASVWSALGD